MKEETNFLLSEQIAYKVWNTEVKE